MSYKEFIIGVEAYSIDQFEYDEGKDGSEDMQFKIFVKAKSSEGWRIISRDSGSKYIVATFVKVRRD